MIPTSIPISNVKKIKRKKKREEGKVEVFYRFRPRALITFDSRRQPADDAHNKIEERINIFLFFFLLFVFFFFSMLKIVLIFKRRRRRRTCSCFIHDFIF